ncbi:MAG: hypothetical protein IT161_12520 [Bryobacterales bacterium]|nr:hypothetical protein [Bryobacterales bacterium]
MSTLTVAIIYLLTFAVAIYLVYRYSHHSWIWHACALLAAVVVGFTPPPDYWSGQSYDLIVGVCFLFLVIWGLGEFIVRGLRLHRHA